MKNRNFNIFSRTTGLALVVSGALFAGSSTGPVTGMEILAGGRVVVFSAGSVIQNKAACASRHEWAFSTETSDGKTLLATLMYAQSTGQNVSVVGTNSCSAWGDRESVNIISVSD